MGLILLIGQKVPALEIVGPVLRGALIKAFSTREVFYQSMCSEGCLVLPIQMDIANCIQEDIMASYKGWDHKVLMTLRGVKAGGLMKAYEAALRRQSSQKVAQARGEAFSKAVSKAAWAEQFAKVASAIKGSVTKVMAASLKAIQEVSAASTSMAGTHFHTRQGWKKQVSEEIKANNALTAHPGVFAKKAKRALANLALAKNSKEQARLKADHLQKSLEEQAKLRSNMSVTLPGIKGTWVDVGAKRVRASATWLKAKMSRNASELKERARAERAKTVRIAKELVEMMNYTL